MRDIFAVYKPKGPSSAQVVNKLKKILDEKKIGHAGTLDPLAEGVLVVGVGRQATKQLHLVTAEDKEYIAVVKLGESSATDDAEGEKTPGKDTHAKSITDIKKILPKFIGRSVWQMPPKFSAIKTGGQRAYKVARQGGDPLLAPRQVDMISIEIIKYDWPLLKIKVICGAGTYIRALARDIGKELGCGGYLSELTRTRVGKFTLANAVHLDSVDKS